MSSKHTPEPWRVEGEDRLTGIYYIGGKESTVCGVFANLDKPTESNAHRIINCVNACEGISDEALKDGVVGEMLDALKDMVKNTRDLYPFLDNNSALGKKVEKAEEAIAKAEGGNDE